jgi:hypothetical protein
MSDLLIIEDDELPTPPTLYSFGKDESDRGSIECKNTYRLQLTSLHMFASALGYIYDEVNEYDGGVFYKDLQLKEDGKSFYKTDKMFVSSKTMIKWHNTCFMPSYSHGLDKELPLQSKLLKLDLDKMKQAIETKLVKQVYFNVTKHKQLQVTRHLIKFI